MDDLEQYNFKNQAKQAQANLDNEILFTWTKADIMSQPDTPKNQFVKELIRRNDDLERRLRAAQENHQRVLSEIQALSSGRGKFG